MSPKFNRIFIFIIQINRKKKIKKKINKLTKEKMDIYHYLCINRLEINDIQFNLF